MISEFHVNRMNLSLQIADHVEEFILSPEVHINDKLPSEQQMATDFCVSRPIIREALKLLVERGLITQRSGSGAFISKPDQANFYKSINRIVAMNKLQYNEIHETRLIMEVSTTRLAAKNITEQQMKELHTIFLAENETHLDMETRVALDASFHNKIAEASGNSLLIKFIKSLISLSEAYMIKGGLSEKGKEDAIKEHRMILEALSAKNAQAASQAMEKHLIQASKNVTRCNFYKK